jgi:hypothetical protein
MIVVARNIATAGICDDARHLAETVPDTFALSVCIRSALDLVGSGCRAEDETWRENELCSASFKDLPVVIGV